MDYRNIANLGLHVHGVQPVSPIENFINFLRITISGQYLTFNFHRLYSMYFYAALLDSPTWKHTCTYIYMYVTATKTGYVHICYIYISNTCTLCTFVFLNKVGNVFSSLFSISIIRSRIRSSVHLQLEALSVSTFSTPSHFPRRLLCLK